MTNRLRTFLLLLALTAVAGRGERGKRPAG
jgi:hypothetical protein